MMAGLNTSMDHWWSDSERGKWKSLGQKQVSVPLCQPQIWHRLKQKADLQGERSSASRLMYFTAEKCIPNCANAQQICSDINERENGGGDGIFHN
jgi:hypothetical protein